MKATRFFPVKIFTMLVQDNSNAFILHIRLNIQMKATE